MRGRTLQAFSLLLRGMALCVFAPFLIVTISPDCTSLSDDLRFVRTLYRRIFSFYFMDLPVDVDSGGAGCRSSGLLDPRFNFAWRFFFISKLKF